MSRNFSDQTQLVVEALRHVAEESVFSLKGGTAINLFYWDMPRLSVDIDLVYLPAEPREVALRGLGDGLTRIMKSITASPGRMRARKGTGGGDAGTRIIVSNNITSIKIEVSPVMRGTVLPSKMMEASDAARERFGTVKTAVASFEDVFAGKFNAALDRQHPRDLYDVKALYERGGITDEMFRVFMVYLASGKRPLHEILAPAITPFGDRFEEDFLGMVFHRVSKKDLEDARIRLFADVRKRLTGDIADFLLSLHDARPDFGLIGFPDAVRLPAVKWKLLNLERLKKENPAKHGEQRAALESILV